MSTTIPSIVGIGANTGYGWGADALWRGVSSGKPAAVLHSGYSENADEDVWLAKVPPGGEAGDSPSRFARAMKGAVREAISDAYARGWEPGRRVGLVHAVVLGDVEDWRDFYHVDNGERRVRDYLRLLPSTPISTLMQEFGFHGPAMNVSATCSSGNVGLITAKMWLDAGIVDDVVCVATDLSLTPENVRHFVRLGAGVVDAEPLDACRPFQEGSRGFAMGEASVGFVVTTSPATGYVDILGGAMSHDAFHVVSVDPDHGQIMRCVRDALADANVRAEDVAYLNAHGPGTKQCDVAETAILSEIFGAARPGVYSVKPLTGHCQGAAAAVEIAAAALGTEAGVVPAAPRVAAGHELLLDGATPMVDGITVKPSLGMGGHNSVVVFAPAG
ncbi:beta-ketoacyl synthase N-terminal-like domain-containing protein [Williamsia sp.]|uniref:beta-ketoacyl synthase N-terminal-like domain-containing protein n=1 Tax=Williamsia sp. TaxID=1872085 RepID=UPI001A26F51F|nr:beta-ketoacyl synthase N-terminal-like domain-containing protein [Williamsia sp.]MBJ7290556.1 3-oxoacyl-ACP synthase [Williamsia sp.]